MWLPLIGLYIVLHFCVEDGPFLLLLQLGGLILFGLIGLLLYVIAGLVFH